MEVGELALGLDPGLGLDQVVEDMVGPAVGWDLDLSSHALDRN